MTINEIMTKAFRDELAKRKAARERDQLEAALMYCFCGGL
jgi:hypothetical protein